MCFYLWIWATTTSWKETLNEMKNGGKGKGKPVFLIPSPWGFWVFIQIFFSFWNLHSSVLMSCGIFLRWSRGENLIVYLLWARFCHPYLVRIIPCWPSEITPVPLTQPLSGPVDWKTPVAADHLLLPQIHLSLHTTLQVDYTGYACPLQSLPTA